MGFKRLVFIITFLMFSFTVRAVQNPDTETIPDILEPWKSWVLHGEEEWFCPSSYNDGQVHHCVWPSVLEINIDPKAGRFSQQWLVFDKSWVILPGEAELWPREVKIDGARTTVLSRGNKPSVFLAHGKHTVEGTFAWDRMPETIYIPPRSGLVKLTINGEPKDFPLIDKKGKLWLQKQSDPLAQEERIEVQMSRLINDLIPMRMTNLLKINVSGRAREIKLEKVHLPGFTPLSLRSPIPARLDNKGELTIQARPGQWEITIHTRSTKAVYDLTLAEAKFGQETWVFQSQNHLRMVKVEGVPSVDPSLTDIPQKWKRFSTYIINQEDKLTFKEIRRGNPDPAPDQLQLNRTWWLDFDGKGFTIKDRIKGTMSRQWYLAMNPPGMLGYVSVDGVDQLITEQGIEKKPGIELRQGRLNLEADSRYESSTNRIPAIGWDHDFQSVSGVLNLPPGWRLISANGVDAMPGTWLERWTLLDLFIVLIIALAVFRIWNWPWGIIALLTLGLTYHEVGAPKLVWISLLAATALLGFIPKGRIKNLINLWRLGSLLVLLVMAIPFIVHQVRLGIYPQLEQPAAEWRSTAIPKSKTDAVRQDKISMGKAGSGAADYRKKRLAAFTETPQQRVYYQKQTNLIQDPLANIQMGPGLPAWTWKRFNMYWNGPVDRSQQVRLWLLSPTMNLIFALLRVILLAVLILRFIDFGRFKISTAATVLFCGCSCLAIFSGPVLADKTSGFPPKELLDQLKSRMLEKPDCLPNCADSPRAEFTLNQNDIKITMEIHAAMDSAVPLPGTDRMWLPKQVYLDLKPAEGLLKDQTGTLWLLVPQGIHRVTLIGHSPDEDAFQISMKMIPRQVTLKSEGWMIQGLSENGRIKGSIKLIRLKKEKEKKTSSTAGSNLLPPFLHIERILVLGLNWEVFTRIKRITPVGQAIVLSVPLIPGESVTTSGIQVEDKKALIHLSPEETEIAWKSTLKQDKLIRLEAPDSVPWAETWVLDVSPIWHLDLSGISVIHHQDKAGFWRPTWQPWPGEKVLVSVSRPKAIKGQWLTIDKALLAFSIGQRFDKAELSLRIRSSVGGQHRIGLPDQIRLQQVKIDNRTQPIRLEGREVVVPLRPGNQLIEVSWHQSKNASLITKGPKVTIGQQAVNAEVVFNLPGGRWILLTAGPRLGPAVLFWTYLCVVILAAIGLGKERLSPLKTGHWLLLGLGLTQIHPLVAIMIVTWLLFLGLRQKHLDEISPLFYNLSQIVIVIWTLAAFIGLYMAIQKGLLGIPDMQITGNNSSDFLLRWTQDRIGSSLPQPWILSLPLLVFRILMLLWALWLAYSLLKWLKWGWSCFTKDGLWKKITSKKNLEEIEPEPVPPPLP